MLTRLRFGNFKAWSDSGDITFAPLTVLFGGNSTGKTSIAQLLVMLKQTAAAPDHAPALLVGGDRALVDLGTYEDVLHHHDLTRTLGIELAWTAPEALTLDDVISGHRDRADHFGFTVALTADRLRQPAVQSFRYDLTTDAGHVIEIGMRRLDDGAGFALHASPPTLVPAHDRIDPLPPPQRFYGFPDALAARYRHATFAADIARALERQLARIHYIGARRDWPTRRQAWSGEVPDDVGTRGEQTIAALLAGQPDHLAARVADRLRAMGLAHDIAVVPADPHIPACDILVATGSDMPFVPLTNVGFGVHQVLPVVVEALYAAPHSVVIVEGPDSHLHPRVQTELADLFIDAIHAHEEGVSRQCQFIVESHSEHFLRRLQRRVAEQALSHDEIALYVIHAARGRAHIDALDLDPFGNIRNWPPGLFGDEMDDLVARARAQARRAADISS